MTIKLFILCLCAAGGMLCGYLVLLSYKRNYVYLSDVCKAIAALRQNLSYKNDSVSSVLEGLALDSALLKKNVTEYAAYVDGKTDAPILSKGFLHKDAYAGAVELFGALGKSDGKTQADVLSAFESKFEKLKTTAETKYIKMGAAAVKLGFLLGLGVGVLAI